MVIILLYTVIVTQYHIKRFNQCGREILLMDKLNKLLRVPKLCLKFLWNTIVWLPNRYYGDSPLQGILILARLCLMFALSIGLIFLFIDFDESIVGVIFVFIAFVSIDVFCRLTMRD